MNMEKQETQNMDRKTSINYIEVTDDSYLLDVCGSIIYIKRLGHGYAVPFEEDQWLMFDTFNDALLWFLDDKGLWVNE